MSHRLINLSHDLRRLREEGYDVSIESAHLVLRSIPYVNSRREVRDGVLISNLRLAGDRTAPPDTHVVWFIGEHPCNIDGTEIVQLTHENRVHDIAPGLRVDRSFSCKPDGGYPDYYEKMVRYSQIISGSAAAIDAAATPRPKNPVEPNAGESVFKYLDTSSALSGISAISSKLAMGRVAIVGLGGSGGYILDQIAKTPIREIHLFDGDKFYSHNAFRAPSAASLEQLRARPSKVAYFSGLYSNMRDGIVPHDGYVTSETVPDLQGFSFVFLCLDKGNVKMPIINYLQSEGIPFIDAGMGVYLRDDLGQLDALCRVTTSTTEKNDHISRRIHMSDEAGPDEYHQNIQIADLNAITALMAVIKWKKFCGFYVDRKREHNSTFTLGSNMLASDELP